MRWRIFFLLNDLTFGFMFFYFVFLMLPGIFYLSLFTSRLTSFLTYYFTYIANTFSFVRFRFTQAAQFSCYLADQLLVNSFQRNDRVLSFFLSRCYFQFFRYFKNEI